MRLPSLTLPLKGGGDGNIEGASWPHQRDRLREVADIVIGHRKQGRIGALGDQVANETGLGMFERERTSEGRERIAAVGILHNAKIIPEQAQLVVAAGLISEAIEQFREAIHAPSPAT